MKSTRLLLASAIVIALASCAAQKDNYDTGNPYGTPDGGQTPTANNTPSQALNPTYDTPAAYEESTAAPAAPAIPAMTEAVNPPASKTPAKHPATAGVVPQGATVHTVVKGDTLGGIARKYKVPAASIKQANNMTKDTVVLGKKLQIPAH